jgi:hypothetical protein
MPTTQQFTSVITEQWGWWRFDDFQKLLGCMKHNTYLFNTWVVSFLNCTWRVGTLLINPTQNPIIQLQNSGTSSILAKYLHLYSCHR